LMESFGTVVSVALQHGYPFRCWSASSRTPGLSPPAGPATRSWAMPNPSWIICFAGSSCASFPEAAAAICHDSGHQCERARCAKPDASHRRLGSPR
jgi:hypothetical protein